MEKQLSLVRKDLQPKRALNDQMKKGTKRRTKKEKDEKKDKKHKTKKEKGENTKAKKDKKHKTKKKKESKNETKDESAAACSDSSSGWITLPTCPTAPKVRVKEQDTESSDAEIPYAVAPLHCPKAPLTQTLSHVRAAASGANTNGAAATMRSSHKAQLAACKGLS